MASFTTSFGKKIPVVPGYRDAHGRFDEKHVYVDPAGRQALPLGIDGFIKDAYEYAIMVDFLESLGLPARWRRALDIGSAEGTMSRLLRGEGRASYAAALDLTDLRHCLTTGRFLRLFAKYRAAAALARFSPTVREFLVGEREWRGKRLTPLYRVFGYMPPPGSAFWRLRLRALPKLDDYLVQDLFTLQTRYDLITAFLALPCFDVERLFAKIAELLEEGGTFFFISDNWWFPVNSSVIVGEFPYASQRLTETDFLRYVREHHPEEEPGLLARYRYYHDGKQRPTLSGYAEIADRFGLELLGCRQLTPPHDTHNRAAITPRVLNRFDDTRLAEVLQDIRKFRPDVGLVDLMTNYHMAAFVKRTRTGGPLSRHLNRPGSR